MEYTEEFKALLKNPNWADKKKYIGVGNPNAKILIVGKECSLDPNTKDDGEKRKYEKTFLQNFDDWKKNNEANWDFDCISPWNEECEIFEKYNPLLPFYEQRFIPLRKLKNGQYNGGTSQTWYNYQKIINYYRARKNKKYEYSKTIDFFKDCFITELSEICRRNNNGLSPEERKKTRESIGERYELICNTPYFQKQFNTIIMVCGLYADELDIEKMFGTAKIVSNAPEYGQPHHLRQLSYRGVTNDLLKDIADHII